MMMEKSVWDGLDEVFRPFFEKNQVSLLIRGLPGAGKTTLALELMNIAKYRYNCMYISTRVSYSRLREQLPWVESMLDESSVLYMADRAARDGNGDARSKNSMLDLRLSTADNLLNMLMDILINKRRAFIVLDSWDSLAKEIPSDERMKMEKTMLAIADANDGLLVFISEEPERNTLAYLVDCVVTLNVEEYDGVWLRKIQMDKMRGVPIKRNKMVYTLHNGRFVLTSSNANVSYASELFQPVSSKQGYISTGNKHLDGILGGIKTGSVVMLEVDGSTNMSYARILTSNIILNNIRSDREAIVACGKDEPVIKVLNKIVPYCLSYDLNRLVVLASPAMNEDQEFNRLHELTTYDKSYVPEDIVIHTSNDPTESTALFIDSYIKLKDYSKSMVIAGNLIWNEFDEVKNRLLYTAKIARNNGDVLVLTVSSCGSIAENASILADVHLKLWECNDTQILTIKKPFKSVYAMNLVGNGYPSYTLLPLL